MQQVSKVILFLREGKFAARAQIRRVKKDTLLTSCIQIFFYGLSSSVFKVSRGPAVNAKKDILHNSIFIE
jgi:hypothetical protein